MTFNHTNLELQKYPRTAHLEGSRLQVGDGDHQNTPYQHLRGRFIVVEEKLDGANVGISFSDGAVVLREGFDLSRAWDMADKSDQMEGLYIKVEEDGQVLERYKWVRSDFVQAIMDSGQHHSTQPYIPNQLAAGVDIFAPALTTTWKDLGLITRTA